MAFTSPVTVGAVLSCGFCSDELFSEAGFDEDCEAAEEEAGLLLSLWGLDEDSGFEEEVLLLSAAELLSGGLELALANRRLSGRLLFWICSLLILYRLKQRSFPLKKAPRRAQLCRVRLFCCLHKLS